MTVSTSDASVPSSELDAVSPSSIAAPNFSFCTVMSNSALLAA